MASIHKLKIQSSKFNQNIQESIFEKTMCGIFALLNNTRSRTEEPLLPDDQVRRAFDEGAHRGPDASTMHTIDGNTVFGFHRLAINGVDNPAANQPLVLDHLTLICNGEIYNHLELYAQMGLPPPPPSTPAISDCEIILHLYRRYGIEHTLQMLDGEFAFILCDADPEADCARLFAARDPYGTRPLYRLGLPLHEDSFYYSNPVLWAFASEVKMLTPLLGKINLAAKSVDRYWPYEISHVSPGTYTQMRWFRRAHTEWEVDGNDFDNVYHTIGNNNRFPFLTEPRLPSDSLSMSSTLANRTSELYQLGVGLVEAVRKRVHNTERPVACLLSGGLDSSLVAAIAQECLQTAHKPALETFSIGLQGSSDLAFARRVADHIGSRHTEIVVSEEDMYAAIPAVISAVETFDTTTIRASLGNYLAGRYIAKHSDAKVVLNGDGSDELFGGYLYMRLAPDAIEFDRETRRLLKDIHRYDVQRSERCMSAHGLESRSPFLDRHFVQLVFSLFSPEDRFTANKTKGEKYWLRRAFADPRRHLGEERSYLVLPSDVLWRRKEAFSDGVSGSMERCLYQILQERICAAATPPLPPGADVAKIGAKMERAYYKESFVARFGEASISLLEYYWMPKYLGGGGGGGGGGGCVASIVKKGINQGDREEEDDEEEGERGLLDPSARANPHLQSLFACMSPSSISTF